MPVTSAALSLVPNSRIARSFSDAAKRSMNSVPTALMSDGPDPAIPHTSSLTPSATPAATTPAMAPSAGVADGRVAGGDGSALSDERSVTTAMAERYARTATTVLAGRETIAKLAGGRSGPRRRGRTVTGVTAPDGPQVLVVDDEPMVREVVATYLQRDGLRVHEAADGPSAEAWLETHRPDLVVLDVMLPGTDGLTILRKLRADGHIPVILLTARADEVDRVVGLELGADDYVVKPFSPRELAARVRNVLRRTSAPPAPAASEAIEAGVAAHRSGDPRGPRRRTPRRADPEGVRPPGDAGPVAAPRLHPPRAARRRVGLGAGVPGPGDGDGARRSTAPEAGGRSRGPPLDHHGARGRLPVRAVIAMSWSDRVAEQPAATALAAIGLLALAVAAGWALRHVARRTRSLRHLLLTLTFGSLLVGAGVALALAALMVLDADGVWTSLVILAVTGVLATVLVLVASGPLSRDVRTLESSVRRIEAGDLSARTGVRRADELGHVARAVDELTERLDAMERDRLAMEEERRAMLSSISHDLRTPLSALRAAVEALADGVAPDPERYLRSMQRDVEVLSTLVDDLFLLARIEAGRVDLERVPLDLSELVDEAVEALAPAAASHGVTIERDAPRARRRGRQPDGARPGRAEPARQRHPARPTGVSGADHASTTPARPRVEVVDEGPGFPTEFREHAFDRFTRADPSRNRATGGAGLGLAIARGLVEAHGGRIWIDGPPGGRVTFELPAA